MADSVLTTDQVQERQRGLDGLVQKAQASFAQLRADWAAASAAALDIVQQRMQAEKELADVTERLGAARETLAKARAEIDKYKSEVAAL